MHWHNAAFNVLYVGIKEWKVMPPWYRAYTGMTAKKANTMVHGDISLSCTQRPGDFVYIPNYWGHMTLNHGFTIG
jgi:oxalate decarboxylase/phosphoglucose isomerase-like protein (cupin superfamily)